MYIITARYKGQNDLRYNAKIEKMVGRCADSFWSNGREVRLKWIRGSSRSVDRIIRALKALRKITLTYCEDGK
jgi:hypothetical protein